MSKTRSGQRDAGRGRHWREVIRAQGSSGQSVREYCRQAGVKEPAFYWWRRELARRSQAAKAARRESQATPPRRRARATGRERSPFLPIHVLTGNATVGVEIHLGDGRMVRVPPGFDQQTLRGVITALEGGRC